MSGPPYPKTLVPGSNAIGSFTIGVSPIGTISPFDYWETIISQYANSPIITTLIGNFYDYIETTPYFEEFFDKIFNIQTAVGYGLDVWGRILGVSRVLQVPSSDQYLGFEEALPDATGFGIAPFYSGAPVTDNFSLSDDAFRLLLYAKAASNITDGGIRSLNRLLLTLFPNRGNCYVTDGLDMTMTYTFEFTLTAVELSIVTNSGVLPRPTGVAATIIAP